MSAQPTLNAPAEFDIDDPYAQAARNQGQVDVNINFDENNPSDLNWVEAKTDKLVSINLKTQGKHIRAKTGSFS